MNRLFWTRKYPTINTEQFYFELPGGFKIVSFKDTTISSKEPSLIDCGVVLSSKEPITLLLRSVIPTIDFKLLTELIILPPHQPFELNLTAINPCYKIPGDYTGYDEEWTIKAGTHIANFVILNTSYTNLFELSNKEFRKL